MEKIDLGNPLRIVGQHKQVFGAKKREYGQKEDAAQQFEDAAKAIGAAYVQLEKDTADLVGLQQREASLRNQIGKHDGELAGRKQLLESLNAQVTAEQAKLQALKAEVEAEAAKLDGLKLEAENFLNRFKA